MSHTLDPHFANSGELSIDFSFIKVDKIAIKGLIYIY